MFFNSLYVNFIKCWLKGNPCLSNPCLNQGVCIYISSTSSFNCQCLPGYTGTTCQSNYNIFFRRKNMIFIIGIYDIIFLIIDSGSGNQCSLQCQNGGYCQYVNGNPQCQCPCFYSGTVCQICKYN